MGNSIRQPKDKFYIEADKLQLALIREHRIKTMVNRRTDGVYTTKEAMKIAEANDWL